MRNNGKEYIVYCHTNNINNKKYIGITCQKPEQRFRNGKGYKSSKYFNSAITKYGWDNFTHSILFEHLSEEEAKSKEIELIAKYKTNNNEFGYNITPGGEGYSGNDNPWFGKHHTIETRKRISEKLKGVPKDEDWKRKIAESNKGKIVTDETKQKMKKPHYSIRGKNHPNYGIKLSQEQIEKMVKASKTPEAIEKMKRSKVWYSGKDNPNSKSVMCIETGIIYDTLSDAAKETGCNITKISAVCHGNRNHTKGLHFKLVTNNSE